MKRWSRRASRRKRLESPNIHIEDLREVFARDYVFPMFRANTLYEGEYLLGTSIARPLIAKRLVEIAAETGADAIAHGATGKGNDQVRFELGAYALNPDIQVIAPWREWNLNSREALLDYCRSRKIPVDYERKGDPPYSMDANLLHISYEGGRPGEPLEGTGREHVALDGGAGSRAGRAGRCRAWVRGRGCHGVGWATHESGGAAGPLERVGRRARRRPAGPGREPLCRHEVPRLLRNPGRRHPLEGAPGDGVPDSRSRSGASEG